MMDKGKEAGCKKFSLYPSCMAFQSELYVLDRELRKMAASNDCFFYILSYSRLSLEILRNPNSDHALARAIRESVREIKL